jgi:pyruvate,water dikinase
MEFKSKRYILWFKNIKIKDVLLVGGKNASLGDMYRHLVPQGINIPNGFALTSSAYFYFLKEAGIDKKLKEIFKKFKPDDIKNLQQTGKQVRTLILKSELPYKLEKRIIRNYRKLCQFYRTKDLSVAVRSSATAEDLPSASFAGAQETYLNVSGEKMLLKAVKKCIASLFTDRAIAYREEKGFEHLKIALSVGIQKMIRSDLGSSGVMFTLDTETGFKNVVLINSIWGVGEMIVKGKITPDEFFVFKPTLKDGYKSIIVKNLGRKTKKLIYSRKGGLKESPVKKNQQLKFSLTDKEILTLAKWGCQIEDYYSKLAGKWMPQDVEWAKDGKTGKLFIVQSRPETVHASAKKTIYKEYEIKTKKEPILRGIAIGDKIGKGKVRIISNVSNMSEFKKGEVLVTKMTDPDWLLLQMREVKQPMRRLSVENLAYPAL